jgi:hypothetical protein
LCIDEPMIPFKEAHSLKQYMKNKPKKWGYKAFVLCDSNGIVYNWELYTGTVKDPLHLPNVDTSGNVVIRLCEIVKPNKYYKVYFDNWFNSIQLQIEMEKRGLQCLGTVLPNRLPYCHFSDDKNMKKQGRGTVEEKHATVDGIRQTALKWYDNKPVHLLSTFVGSEPTSLVKRWDKKQKSRIIVCCPNSVQFYNKFIGGVDLMDSLIALYRTDIRSKKWYLKIFFHLLDLAVVNSWLLHPRDCDYFEIKKKNQLPLLQFKSHLCSVLLASNDQIKNKGRPRLSEIENEIVKKQRRGSTAIVLPKEVRLDQRPVISEKKGRCKKPGCCNTSKVMCDKCKVALCFTTTNICFFEWHNK